MNGDTGVRQWRRAKTGAQAGWARAVLPVHTTWKVTGLSAAFVSPAQTWRHRLSKWQV